MRIPNAKFVAVPLADVADQYDLGELTNDSVYLDDLFGEAPEHVYVHRGDLVVTGALELVGDPSLQSMFVVEGDLRVEGAFLFRSGWSIPLIVTGDVAANSLVVERRAMLIVGGDLVLDGPLVTALDDMGHLVIHGDRFVASAWIDHYGRGGVESIPRPEMPLYFDAADNGNAPQSRHEFHDPALLAATIADDGDRVIHTRANLQPLHANTVVPAALWDGELLDTNKLCDALLAGRSILRAP